MNNNEEINIRFSVRLNPDSNGNCYHIMFNIICVLIRLCKELVRKLIKAYASIL